MSRPEGYRSTKQHSSDDDDDDNSYSEEESSSEEEESSSEEEEEEKEKKQDKTLKKNKKKKDKKVEVGDKCNVVEALKMCLSVESDKKINPELVYVCGANSSAWKHPDWTGTQPLSYPETPLRYKTDYNYATPNEILTINGLTKGYGWKDALTNPSVRCFHSAPPVDVHLESQVHSVKLTFNFSGGDYLNLPKVCEQILVTSRSQRGYTNLSLGVDQKQQLFKVLGNSVDSSTTKMDTSCRGGYHMFIRDIFVTDYVNNLPITFGCKLVTHDPLTGKEKSWCNNKQITSIRSSSFKGANVVTIPSCSSTRDIIERMWTVPPEHYHPDVSRFINVNFDMLQEELQELRTSKAQRVYIGPEPTKAQLKEQGDVDKRAKYSTYEIKMPELTSTKAETMIQFIVWERYADILLRTSAVPDITTKQEGLYTDYDTGIKGYRLLCVVFDSIVAEYEPYTRHRNYLMSLDGPVTFAMMPERSLTEVEQDIKNFIADPKAQHYGAPPSVTIQIDFEKFQNNEAILPKSSETSSKGGGDTVVKKKKKSKVRSNKKDLLKRSKSGSVKPPKNRNDYLDQVMNHEQQMTMTGAITDPGMSVATDVTTTPGPAPIIRTRRPTTGILGNGSRRLAVLGSS